MNKLWALFKVTAVNKENLYIKYMQVREKEGELTASRQMISPQVCELENEIDIIVLTYLV